MDAPKTILEKRDAKAKPHLEQYAPVWLVEEKMIPQDEATLFEVVFQHNMYGWVKRRYRFDGFNNVLYYRGQITLSEEAALPMIGSKEPYISTLVADIPNAYGG
jgi:hypothetical protein